MGLQIASVGGGVITLSNGQRVQAGQAGLAGSQNTPPTAPGTGPYAAGGIAYGSNPATGAPYPDPTIQGVQGPAAGPAKTPYGPVPVPGWEPFASTATTPVAPAMAPKAAPTDYYAQYEASLNASRANLEGQYVQAQSSIDQQQRDANATLATLPGKFATIASQQTAGAQRETGILLKADTAAGMGGTQGSGGALANSQAEMSAAASQNAAGNKALVPDLGLGIKTQMDAERASLADAHSTAQGALDAAAMNVQASRAGAATSDANATAAQQTAHNQAVTDATTAYKRQLTLAAIDNGAKLNAPSTKVPGMTVGDEKLVATSPYFTLVTNELNTNKMADGSAPTSAGITKQIASIGANANIPGFNGAVSTGLLQVLKTYYGSTYGLTK